MKIFKEIIVSLLIGFLIPSMALAGQLDYLSSMGSLSNVNTESGTLNMVKATGTATKTFTVNRNSVPATYFDANGVMQSTTTNNVEMYTYGDYDATGWHAYPGGAVAMLEGQSTNLLVHSIFDAGTTLATGWNTTLAALNGTPSYSLVTESLTNISGSRSQKIEYTGVAADSNELVFWLNQTSGVGTFAIDNTATISVWIKGTTQSELKFDIFFKNAGGTNLQTLRSSDISGLLSATEHRRFTFSLKATHADTSIAQIALTGSSIDNGEVTSIEISCFQLEVSAYPSSFIPTTTASLTRPSESTTYVANDGNFPSNAIGSVVFAYRPVMKPSEQAASYKTLWSLSYDGSNGINIAYDTNANNKVALNTLSGGTTLQALSSALTSWNRNELHVLTGTFSTTADGAGKKINLYDNAGTAVTNANYTAPSGSLPATFSIQPDANEAMHFVGLDIFPTVLTAAQISTVQTLKTQCPTATGSCNALSM